MPVYIVLLGPPGAGKGTQAKVISETLGLVHVSSGDIFRENLKAQTDLGKLAQTYMNKGELVPDDVTIAMIKDRLSKPDCAKGALLDGFPRTPAQAVALDATLKVLGGKVQCVPLIAVAPEVLIERLSGRWSCRAQGHVYHAKYNPPKQAGICDVDGSELYQREDDQPATVERRIKVYVEQTAPLIEYYTKNNLLVEIDGTQAIEVVTEKMMSAIKKAIK
jgi:adenylate kinase